MKTKLLLLMCVVAFGLHAQKIIYVNHTQTGIADGTSWQRAYANLNNAITTAQDGDEIWVAQGTYKPGTTRASTYYINRSIKIYGGFTGTENNINQRDITLNPTVIDGDIGVLATHTDNIYNLFTIARTSSVSIDGFVLQNAYADGQTINASGGAVHNQADTLSILNTKFSNNVGIELAGAVYCDSTAKVSLYAVEFEGNYCATGSAAITLENRSAHLILDSALFVNQNGSKNMILANTSHIDANKVSFINNVIDKELFYCTNANYNFNFTDILFTQNTATSYLYLIGKRAILKNIHIENNTEPEYSNYPFYLQVKDIEIDNMYLKEEAAWKVRLINTAQSDRVKVTNSYFSRTHALGATGIMYVHSKRFELDNVKFIDVLGGLMQAACFYFSGGDTLLLNNVEFNNIEAQNSASFYATVSTIATIKNCKFENNKVTNSNSCFTLRGNANVHIDSTQFKLNIANFSVGAFSAGGTNMKLKVTNCAFTDNIANSMTGALDISVDTLTIDQCVFERNTSNNVTGAVSVTANYAKITRSVFNQNTNDFLMSSGGAITFYNAESESIVDSCSFSMNTAAMGGAIYSLSKNTLITRSLFDSNTAKSEVLALWGTGGAIYSQNNTIRVYGCVFTGQTATRGGVIYYLSSFNENSLNLINNTFYNNRVSKDLISTSGAIFMSQNSVANMYNNVFKANGDSAVFFENHAGQLTQDRNIIDTKDEWIPQFQGNSADIAIMPISYKPFEHTRLIDYGIDTEFNTMFSHDLFGNPRIQGSGIDIGAVESPYYMLYRTLTGNVLFDQNKNCIADANEKGIRNITIKANPGGFMTQTDQSGNYTLKVLPETTYTISQHTNHYEGYIEPICPANSMYENVEVSLENMDYETFNFFNDLETCERMDVRIYPSRMRNCFSGGSRVALTNLGGVNSETSILKISYPDEVTVISTLPQADSSSNNDYYFSIPSIPSMDTYSIRMIDSVKCDPSAENLGKEISFRAAILHNETCSGTDPRWDRSEITVTGTCDENDRVSFMIQNSGSGTMDQALPYRIFLYDTLVYEGTFELAVGTAQVIEAGYETGALRLEAQQSAYYPLNSNPTATVNGCGLSSQIENTLVRFTADNRAFGKDERHTMIIGSYDPNEIEVSPIGWGEEGNVVLSDVLFTYTIHFQNTGNDTAFTVVLIDSLPLGLDVTTISLQDASHNYTFEQIGEHANVLKWTFNNINLVDSLTDEKGSMGYVRFTILPKSNLAIGTQLRNKAYIYFDFNLPIITNTVLNTIQHEYPRNMDRLEVVESIITHTTEKQTSTLALYPNPVLDQLTINVPYDQIDVFSPRGDLIHRLTNNENTNINTSEWSQGMYLIKVYTKSDTQIVKIVKQ